MIIRTAITKPTRVQYAQFWNWSGWLEISSWAKNVYFVPEGYEHPLRNEGETDRSHGGILEKASCFLVIKNDEGDVRVDRGWFLVQDQRGEFTGYSPDEFKAKFNV